jgi:hypothetical protein
MPNWSDNVETRQKLNEIAEQLKKVRLQRLELELELEQVAKEECYLAEKVLPEAMEAAGFTHLQTKDGTTFSLEERMTFSVPKKNVPAAHAFLEKEGHGDLIKSWVGAYVPAGESTAPIENAISSTGAEVEIDKKIEPATLRALLKNWLKEGKEFPLDLFGVFRKTVAVVSQNQ